MDVDETGSDRTKDGWVVACEVGDVEVEDVTGFEYGDRTLAVYRSPEDVYYATDGLCTHEQAYLSEGFVQGHIIECPKHNGRFDYRTGQAKGAPVCIDLCVYSVRVEAGKVLVQIGQG